MGVLLVHAGGVTWHHASQGASVSVSDATSLLGTSAELILVEAACTQNLQQSAVLTEHLDILWHIHGPLYQAGPSVSVPGYWALAPCVHQEMHDLEAVKHQQSPFHCQPLQSFPSHCQHTTVNPPQLPVLTRYSLPTPALPYPKVSIRQAPLTPW